MYISMYVGYMEEKMIHIKGSINGLCCTVHHRRDLMSFLVVHAWSLFIVYIVYNTLLNINRAAVF